MNPAGMIGVGRRLASKHRPLASNLTHGPVQGLDLLPSRRAFEGFSPVPLSPKVFGTVPMPVPKPTPIRDTPTAVSTAVMNADQSSDSPVLSRSGTSSVAPVLQNADQSRDAPVLSRSGTSSVAPVLQTVVNNLPSGFNRTGLRLMRIKGARTLVSQIRSNFCTSAVDPTKAGEFIFKIGNTQELCQRITTQVDDMKTRVLGFQSKYKCCIRPSLASRCLIVPNGIKDASTVFLHRQTLAIAKFHPSYMSCFDAMVFETGCLDREGEWERFLDHVVKKKIYVIEDWNTSFSTVETLMYDHGLKEPDDGSGVPFYKGECDASFDKKTKTWSLGYIIWKDDKIIFSEVFSCVNASSASDAEIYAALALLYKAEELGIRKLLVCSDSKTMTTVLNGERPISMNHEHRDLYLMLRAMRSRFKWLVATWKPRELMVFADALTRAAEDESNSAFVPRLSIANWFGHLRGLPVYRVERTRPTTTAVNQFKDVTLEDGDYGRDANSTYFVEVEEDLKYDCVVGLHQALKPSEMKVYLKEYGDKSVLLKQLLEAMDDKRREYGDSANKFDSDATHGASYELEERLNNYGSKSDLSEQQMETTGDNTKSGHVCCYTLIDTEPGKHAKRPKTKSLVVAFDYSVPKHVYYDSDAFHVVLVTPSELNNMTERIPELTALGFVHFNGVRLPLNELKKDKKKQ